MSAARNYGRSVICSKNEPHDAVASVIGISRYINVGRKGGGKKREREEIDELLQYYSLSSDPVSDR